MSKDACPHGHPFSSFTRCVECASGVPAAPSRMNTTITDSDIEQLRAEADEDGEDELFVLAVKALLGDRHARAECTHIILASRMTDERK